MYKNRINTGLLRCARNDETTQSDNRITMYKSYQSNNFITMYNNFITMYKSYQSNNLITTL